MRKSFNACSMCNECCMCALVVMPSVKFRLNLFSRNTGRLPGFSVIFLGSDIVRFIYGKMLRNNIRFGRCMS